MGAEVWRRVRTKNSLGYMGFNMLCIAWMVNLCGHTQELPWQLGAGLSCNHAIGLAKQPSSWLPNRKREGEQRAWP